MANPILVEVTRGGTVESVHRGAVAVSRPDGSLTLTLGDTARPVFPRSAIKLLQALPLIETGAAQVFGFGNEELALAGASHNGEPAHTRVAARMLQRAGLDASALLCGAHEPMGKMAARELLRAHAAPSPLHSNCSGKHAGMLATACHCGEDPRGYVGIDHPVQRRIAAVIGAVTGVAMPAAPCGVDGCSVPTWALPLAALAAGFARLASGQAIGPDRQRAAARLFAAAIAEPHLVAGTDRFCTRAMQAAGGHAFVKTGAEGVFCSALPAPGIGITLKIDDGASRASEVVMAGVLARLLALQGGPAAERSLAVGALATIPVLSVRGQPVGDIRLSAELSRALDRLG